MGTAALTLGIVGMFTWFIPFIGFAINTAGIILGLIERLARKKQNGRAIAGIILCILGIALGIGALVGLVTAGLIIDDWLRQPYLSY
ncbi:MAG: hypothetical protein Q8O55_02460 [Dehalococcoidales bacterium]|nr:hypothetical protein [Dehalococcoidales bacterium]